MRRIRTLVQHLFIVCLLALVAAACSSDSSSSEAISSPTPTTPPPAEGTPAAEFLALITHGIEIPYIVTYRTTTVDGAPGDTIIVSNLPPFARVDTIPSEANAPASTVISNTMAETAVSCTGGPDAWRCTEIASLGESVAQVAGPVVYLDADDVALFDIEEIEQRTLAGEFSRCFRLTPREDTGTVEYCLSDDGVPLFSAPLFGTVEAISISFEVSAGDFQPPVLPE